MARARRRSRKRNRSCHETFYDLTSETDLTANDTLKKCEHPHQELLYQMPAGLAQIVLSFDDPKQFREGIKHMLCTVTKLLKSIRCSKTSKVCLDAFIRSSLKEIGCTSRKLLKIFDTATDSKFRHCREEPQFYVATDDKCRQASIAAEDPNQMHMEDQQNEAQIMTIPLTIRLQMPTPNTYAKATIDQNCPCNYDSGYYDNAQWQQDYSQQMSQPPDLEEDLLQSLDSNLLRQMSSETFHMLQAHVLPQIDDCELRLVCPGDTDDLDRQIMAMYDAERLERTYQQKRQSLEQQNKRKLISHISQTSLEDIEDSLRPFGRREQKPMDEQIAEPLNERRKSTLEPRIPKPPDKEIVESADQHTKKQESLLQRTPPTSDEETSSDSMNQEKKKAKPADEKFLEPEEQQRTGILEKDSSTSLDEESETETETDEKKEYSRDNKMTEGRTEQTPHLDEEMVGQHNDKTQHNLDRKSLPTQRNRQSGRLSTQKSLSQFAVREKPQSLQMTKPPIQRIPQSLDVVEPLDKEIKQMLSMRTQHSLDKQLPRTQAQQRTERQSTRMPQRLDSEMVEPLDQQWKSQLHTRLSQPRGQQNIEPLYQQRAQYPSARVPQPRSQPTLEPVYQQKTQSMSSWTPQHRVYPSIDPLYQQRAQSLSTRMPQHRVYPSIDPLYQQRTQNPSTRLSQPLNPQMLQLFEREQERRHGMQTPQYLHQQALQSQDQERLRQLSMRMSQPVDQHTMNPMDDPRTQRMTMSLNQQSYQPQQQGRVEQARRISQPLDQQALQSQDQERFRQLGMRMSQPQDQQIMKLNIPLNPSEQQGRLEHSTRMTQPLNHLMVQPQDQQMHHTLNMGTPNYPHYNPMPQNQMAPAPFPPYWNTSQRPSMASTAPMRNSDPTQNMVPISEPNRTMLGPESPISMGLRPDTPRASMRPVTAISEMDTDARRKLEERVLMERMRRKQQQALRSVSSRDTVVELMERRRMAELMAKERRASLMERIRPQDVVASERRANLISSIRLSDHLSREGHLDERRQPQQYADIQADLRDSGDSDLREDISEYEHYQRARLSINSETQTNYDMNFQEQLKEFMIEVTKPKPTLEAQTSADIIEEEPTQKSVEIQKTEYVAIQTQTSADTPPPKNIKECNCVLPGAKKKAIRKAKPVTSETSENVSSDDPTQDADHAAIDQEALDLSSEQPGPPKPPRIRYMANMPDMSENSLALQLCSECRLYDASRLLGQEGKVFCPYNSGRCLSAREKLQLAAAIAMTAECNQCCQTQLNTLQGEGDDGADPGMAMRVANAGEVPSTCYCDAKKAKASSEEELAS